MQNDEWIRSKALLTLLAEQRPDWTRPEFNLRPYLAHGMIRGKCRSAEMAYRLPHGGSRKETVTDWEIPPAAWKGNDFVPGVFGLSEDLLASPIKGFSFRSVLCLGLSFNLSDVIDACELNDQGIAETTAETALGELITIKTGFAGRPSLNFLIEEKLDAWIRDNKVPPGKQTDVAKALIGAVQGDYPNQTLPHVTPKTVTNTLNAKLRLAIQQRDLEQQKAESKL